MIFFGFGVKLLHLFGEASIFCQEFLDGSNKLFSCGLAQIVERDVCCRYMRALFSHGASSDSVVGKGVDPDEFDRASPSRDAIFSTSVSGHAKL